MTFQVFFIINIILRSLRKFVKAFILILHFFIETTKIFQVPKSILFFHKLNGVLF